MMSAEKLAYFFDHADLGSVFADWPVEIGLVLCMDDEGSCEMLLHHRDEEREVLGRVAALLERPVGQFAVVPPVEGHPTRRILFSEAQKLMAMVAAETELPEMAVDYLTNHQFESERRARRKKPAAKAAKTQGWRPRFNVTDVRSKPDPARESKEAAVERIKGARAQAVPPSNPAPHQSPFPNGYLSAQEVRSEECRFANGVISLGRRGVRLVIAPERLTVHTPSTRVEEVGFRDDFSRFVVPREVAKGWQVEDPLVIDIPVEMFPAGMQRHFALAPRHAAVTVTRHGVFVAPGDEVRAESPAPDRTYERAADSVAQPQELPRRILTPFRLALAALTGVGLMTGSVMRAVDVPDRPGVSIIRIEAAK